MQDFMTQISQNPLGYLGLGIGVLGAVLLALGGLVWKVRAILNKQAWNGATKPLIGIGIFLVVVGGALLGLSILNQG